MHENIIHSSFHDPYAKPEQPIDVLCRLYLKKMIFYSPADDEDLKLCVALTQIIIPWNQGIHPKSATVSPPAQIPTPPCVTLTLLTEMTSPCLKMPSEIELAPPYKLLTLLH